MLYDTIQIPDVAATATRSVTATGLYPRGYRVLYSHQPNLSIKPTSQPASNLATRYTASYVFLQDRNARNIFQLSIKELSKLHHPRRPPPRIPRGLKLKEDIILTRLYIQLYEHRDFQSLGKRWRKLPLSTKGERHWSLHQTRSLWTTRQEVLGMEGYSSI